jgi:hypothetical protein
MTYSVHQHWDPLKVCVVGRSYPPEFYSWIKNSRLRSLFERIAIETEEDFQLIIKTLKKFNVDIIRPDTPATMVEEYLTSQKRIPGPISMNPRDQMIMIGDKFYFYPHGSTSEKTSGRNIPQAGWDRKTYRKLRKGHWPEEFTPFYNLPEWIQEEVKKLPYRVHYDRLGEDLEEICEQAGKFNWWEPVFNAVKQAGNTIIHNLADTNLNKIPANGITRIGKDLYLGCNGLLGDKKIINNLTQQYFSNYRCHWVDTYGHIDGCFTPIKPGLIVSIRDIKTYEKTFPDWEVVYLPNESWSKVQGFLDLKKKNQGRWWIKDYEHDHELIELVETWLQDWTGYAEESVFDVNILVIDQNNAIVNGYNKQVFDAFERHNVTPHICPVRHRYFWDGGIHCITLDLDRQGSMQDYFPERNQ